MAEIQSLEMYFVLSILKFLAEHITRLSGQLRVKRKVRRAPIMLADITQTVCVHVVYCLKALLCLLALPTYIIQYMSTICLSQTAQQINGSRLFPHSRTIGCAVVWQKGWGGLQYSWNSQANQSRSRPGNWLVICIKWYNRMHVL